MQQAADRRRAWIESLFVDHAMFRLVWTNRAVVIPGRLYRSNHPTPFHLRRAQRDWNIKTLINLRGRRDCGSDALSRHAADRLGLAHVDMAFESRGAPHRDRILRFASLYDQIAFPALMHCKSGADRSGLAAGLAILFEGGETIEALRHLSWRYGHFKQARTGILDAFFGLYAQEAEGRIGFLQWIERGYDEYALRAKFKADGLAEFLVTRVLARE